ncbi:MAG: hypothetical protein ACE5G8_01620 [Anaerolineae bacterium]
MVEPGNRVWVVMPHSRRPALQTFVEANQTRLVEAKRCLGIKL